MPLGRPGRLDGDLRSLHARCCRRFAPNAEMQFVENAPWISAFGIHYLLGVDGISIYLVLLTTLLTPIVVLSSWRDVGERVREFHLLLLLLETGMLGAFWPSTSSSSTSSGS